MDLGTRFSITLKKELLHPPEQFLEHFQTKISIQVIGVLTKSPQIQNRESGQM